VEFERTGPHFGIQFGVTPAVARRLCSEQIAKQSESVIRAGFVPDSFRRLSLTKCDGRCARETISLPRAEACGRLN
jgi:hypothetical protein